MQRAKVSKKSPVPCHLLLQCQRRRRAEWFAHHNGIEAAESAVRLSALSCSSGGLGSIRVLLHELVPAPPSVVQSQCLDAPLLLPVRQALHERFRSWCRRHDNNILCRALNESNQYIKLYENIMILCLSNQIMHKYSNLRARIDNDEAYFSSDFCGGEYFVGKYETIHK